MNHKRTDENGLDWYSDGTYEMSHRDTCHHCSEERESQGKPFRFGDEQYSFGIYAGRYCEECWKKSGYRDATDPNAEWSPLDCGEVMEPEDY